MDLFGLITPVNLPISINSWLPIESLPTFSNSEITRLKNVLFNTRSKLANQIIDPYNNNNLNNYLIALESYVHTFFQFVKVIDEALHGAKHKENLLALAATLPLIASTSSSSSLLLLNSIPWKLPITASNSNQAISIEWLVAHEIQISLISLSLLYFKIGLNIANKDLYNIKLPSGNAKAKEFQHSQNTKWGLVINNFFKKSLAIIEYLQDHSYSIVGAVGANGATTSNNLIETSPKFINFLNSYINANFQLTIVIKNFWSERLESFIKNESDPLSYNLEDLNSDFYKQNNYYLLIKILSYVFNQLNDLLNFLSDFKQNLFLYYGENHGNNTDSKSKEYFKSFIKNLISELADSDDEEEEKSAASKQDDHSASTPNSKRFFKKIIKRLNFYHKLVAVFIVYIKLYLTKYLTLDSYIMQNQVGQAISLIDFGFEVASKGSSSSLSLSSKKLSIDSTGSSGSNNTSDRKDKLKQKFSFKKKLHDRKASKDQFIPVASSNNNSNNNVNNINGCVNISQLDNLLHNSSVYKTLLLQKSANDIIIYDFTNLLINLKNLRYKFNLQNDNLSFEKVTKLNEHEFLEKLPLARQLPVNLAQWDPMSLNSERVSTDLDGNGGPSAYY